MNETTDLGSQETHIIPFPGVDQNVQVNAKACVARLAAKLQDFDANRWLRAATTASSRSHMAPDAGG